MVATLPKTNILTAASHPALLDRLKEMLAGATSADIAAGYLFISGFAELTEVLNRDAMRTVRVLVGRVDRPTLEAVASGVQQAQVIERQADRNYVPSKSEKAAAAEQSAGLVGEGVARLEQTDRNESAIGVLRELVGSGKLDIKTYPYGMLHAKAYLCWYDGPNHGAAIVGSSNLTLGGFLGNTELNVRLANDSDMYDLKEWFDGLWADSIDISDDILTELSKSWPLHHTTPFEIYLKTLYELYGAQDTPAEIDVPARGAPALANFQLDAVRSALTKIETHGGCFIGDVVGLGKTFIGSELVRQVQITEPLGRHPLIIAPAGLVPMWEMMSERFGLGAAVVSMSMISPPPGTIFDEDVGDYVDAEEGGGGIDLIETYPNRGVVLVDEAHNFRNPSTRRYRALYHYLWSGDHKTILLSATPQNLGPFDIYHQLRLFLDDIHHGLSLEPLVLQEYFSAVEKWYQYAVALANWQREMAAWQEAAAGRLSSRPKTGPPAAPDQPAVPYATIEQVLNPVFIRRRRKDIVDIYGEDVEVAGKPAKFPDPKLANLPYVLDRVYASAMPFDQLWKQLEAHTGARYRALDYLTPAARASDKYKDLARAHNRVAVLVRFLLLKRLESSVAAFRSTLSVLATSNRNFKSSLESGFVPLGKTATSILAGEDFTADELLERLEEEQERRSGRTRRSRLIHSTDDFEIDRWIEDLDADHDRLAHILDRISHVAPADDDKLQTLRQFLAQDEQAHAKILIFSEAAATIDYLYENLNPGGVDHAIAKISGSNRESMASIIRRFAPRANLGAREKLHEPEVRILLATDVVSEGQNLQDCNRVLNYDLHWNPVRLIQRFGRVDRIGTEHDTIFLHNMWPDSEVDKGLSLTERLHKRVQAFHDFIGLDAVLLSASERLNPGTVYAIYDEDHSLPLDEGGHLDEVSAYQRGVGVLQQIQDKQPEVFDRVRRLPDGIRSARSAGLSLQPFDARLIKDLPGELVQVALGSVKQLEAIETPMDAPRAGETVIFLKTRDIILPYAVGADLNPRRLTPSQLLNAVECAEDTPRDRLPTDTNARVMAAFAQAQQELSRKLGVMAVPKSHERSRRYLRRQLNLLREEHKHDDEELQRLQTLQRIFVQGHYQTHIGEQLDTIRKTAIAGDALLARLDALRLRFRLNPSDGSANESGRLEVLRIVCSEGLV
jgi:superfamily II DNA or RNA helicase